MSRAYRIRVKESLKRDLKAEDSIKTARIMNAIAVSAASRQKPGSTVPRDLL